MQSTGQGATHSAQPLHNAAKTECICFGAPMIASTGHASMHSVQPMQRDSSMRARASTDWLPNRSSSRNASRPVSVAIATIVVVPPGAQRFSGSPAAIASA